MELHDSEKGESFHTDDEIPPLVDEEDVPNQQGSEDQRQREGGTPNRLNSEQSYIPAGEESEGTASSQESLVEELTVETGLAEFFQNPSYMSCMAKTASFPCELT